MTNRNTLSGKKKADMQPDWLQPLEWDSRFFDHAIARLAIPAAQLRPTTVQQQLQRAKERGFRCVYLEIPLLGPELVSLCQQPEFQLVDIKTTLIGKLKGAPYAVEESQIAITPDFKNFQDLSEIADELARKSRFALDPRFGLQESIRLYREWLRASLQESYGFDFLTAVVDGRARGLLTLKMHADIPYIDLIGVHSQYRGQGLASALLHVAANRLHAAGYHSWCVVTQGFNIEALQFYQKHGFRTIHVALYYHVWLDRTGSGA